MIDSNTLALFHFNNDVYTESINPSAWTAIGNAQLDTTDPKFGNGCLYNSSSSLGGCSRSYDSAFDFGTGDLTVDFWWKQPTSGSAYTGGGANIYGGTVNGTFLIHYLDGGNTANFGISYQGYPSGASGFRTTDGEWHHHALVRASGVAYFFLDGELKGSQADTNSYNFTSSDNIYILSQNGANILLGYVDEFRISNVARWTSNFTPPTMQYGINCAYLSNNNLYTGASLTNLTNSWNTLTNAQKEALVPSFRNEIPSIQDLATISPFRVLTDDTSLSDVKVTGQPKSQTIEPTSLINTGVVSTIQSINITNTLTDVTVKFAITTDLTTYKVYDATQGDWVSSIAP